MTMTQPDTSPRAIAFELAIDFLTIGGRFFIGPTGQPEAAVNAGSLLAIVNEQSLPIPDRVTQPMLDTAKTAFTLCAMQLDEMTTLIRDHGQEEGNWIVWTAPPFHIAKAAWEGALARFEALPLTLEEDDPEAWEREEKLLHAALARFQSTPISNWQDFTTSFEVACQSGFNSTDAERLITAARILAYKEEGQ